MKQWLGLVKAGRLAVRRREQGLYDQDTYALYARWAGLNLKARVEWCKYSLEYQGALPTAGCSDTDLPARCRGKRLLFNALNCRLAAGLDTSLEDRANAHHIGKLVSLAEHSPAIAAWLIRCGIDLPPRALWLASIDQNQQAWRTAFIREVLGTGKSLCVVGNAAVLEGKGLASAIDAHDFVFRFNHFLPPESGARTEVEADIGSRLSGWVAASDLSPPFNGIEQLNWLLLSGPDIRYRLYHWGKWLGFVQQGTPLITFPVSTWSGLVQKLKAPPSAGLLFLAWLLEHVGTDAQLSIAGFQLEPPGERYHLALKGHKAGARHNWDGERTLIRKWLGEGRLRAL